MPMLSRYAILLAMLPAVACGTSSTPPAAAVQPVSQAAPADAGSATGPRDTAPDSPNFGELAAAFGLGGALPLPKALVPGGDCPPVGNDAARDIDAQAAAAVPLKEGLTLAYSWMRTPQEEYECLIQVKHIADEGVDTSLSCNHPERGGPFLKRVCRSDLRDATMLHTMYGVVKVIGPSGEEQPETVVGATAFSLSSAEFARLKTTGVMTHHYVEVGSSGQLDKQGIGELHVEGRAMMNVIVNDRPIELPVIKARGKLKWEIRHQKTETDDTLVVLDDERFPLLIDQQSSNEITAARIQFAKISYPSGGGSPVEGGLLRSRRVDVYGIYFDFNSDRIRAESEPVLKEIGEVMTRHPEWHITIDGHTDNVGGNGDYNLQLSRRRSQAVRTALVARFGIAADRLTSDGHGAASPKDTNDTPEGRARNRRVELVLQ